MSRIQISDKELLELIEQGKTNLEIVRIKGIRYESLIRRTHKTDKTLLDEAMKKGQTKREETIQKEQEEILKLIGQGKNQSIIAEAMDVQQIDISMRIREIDKGLVDEAIKEGIRQGFVRVSRGTREIEQEYVLELIRQNENVHKMAKACKLNDTTMIKKILRMPKTLVRQAMQEAEEKKQEEDSKVDPVLVKETREEARRRKQEEILELIGQGKSISEMADILGIPYSTVYNRVNTMNQDTIIREKMKKGQLTVADVKKYRDYVDEKYDRATYDEIVLLINAYIKTKQITEAIRFLNTIISDEGLRCLDIEKIKNIKLQVEQIQKRQMVRKMLRDGKKINYIMAQTGLKERKIEAIKEEMEQKLGREI